MMNTKNKILAMERQRLGGCRLKTRFPWMGNSEFCEMLGLPLDGTDEQLWHAVQSGIVEDFSHAYRQGAAQ
jgi:hypothetical protein